MGARKRDPRWPTAIHEAGHAVVARELGRAVVRVSIEADEDEGSLGRMLGRELGAWFRPDASINGRVRRRLEDDIMVSLAGAEAESHVSTTAAVRAGAGFDWGKAADLALYMAGSDLEAEAHIEWLRLRTANLIGAPLVWVCIEALATRLMEKSTLNGREVRESISSTIRDVFEFAGMSLRSYV